MCLEEFYENFKNSGIGSDHYKTIIEFKIEEEFIEEDSNGTMLNIYDCVWGFSHHGKKYEISEHFVLNDHSCEQIDYSYNFKEVDNFSDLKKFYCPSICEIKRELEISDDKIGEVINMFSNYNASNITVEPDDIIFKNFVIFLKDHDFIKPNLHNNYTKKGIFSKIEGIKRISQKEYLSTFVDSLDKIIKQHKSAIDEIIYEYSDIKKTIEKNIDICK